MIIKETKLVKWGNSLAVRTPHEVIQQLDLKSNQPLTVYVKGDSIVLTPVTQKPQDIHELFENWEDDGIRGNELPW